MKRMAFLLTAAAVAGTTLLTSAAAAQSAPGRACGDRNKIIERLSVKYGETRQSVGLNHNNGMLEVFASTETGTWTILITMPTGTSCLLAAGESWDGAPAQVTKSGQTL